MYRLLYVAVIPIVYSQYFGRLQKKKKKEGRGRPLQQCVGLNVLFSVFLIVCCSAP